jgi:hypothetical protein
LPESEVTFRLVSGAELDRSLRGTGDRVARNLASSSSTSGMNDGQFSRASRPASSGERLAVPSFRYAVKAVKRAATCIGSIVVPRYNGSQRQMSQQDAGSTGVNPLQNRCQNGRSSRRLTTSRNDRRNGLNSVLPVRPLPRARVSAKSQAGGSQGVPCPSAAPAVRSFRGGAWDVSRCSWNEKIDAPGNVRRDLPKEQGGAV